MNELDIFGNEIIKDVLLRDKFIEPPFSVLNSQSGSWQKRKRKWLQLGIESEIGRKENLTYQSHVAESSGISKADDRATATGAG